MIAIPVIYNGKAFVPRQPISLPDQSEAVVYSDREDSPLQAALDIAIRAYYQGDPNDTDDTAWGSATAPQSHRAWEED